MVAWCQESNGSIPQSQLLQVRKMHKWICDTAKSGLAYIMNLCVTLTWLCDCQCSRMSILVHPNGFWTAYSCLVIAERPRYWSMEGIQVWRTHFPDGPLIFFFFFFPPAQNFLNSSSCPEIQGFLYLKETGRKSWKKLYMFLRRSGLYCSTKGMSKASFSLNLF